MSDRPLRSWSNTKLDYQDRLLERQLKQWVKDFRREYPGFDKAITLSLQIEDEIKERQK